MAILATQDIGQIDPQTTSSFFKPPVEIRRLIYSYLINTAGVHVVGTGSDGFHLSPCLGPDLYAEHTGIERCVTINPFDDNAISKRRLASTWGPHWMCEEWNLQMEESRVARSESAWHSHKVLLGVCKRTHSELVDIMTEMVHFHVTDLFTLNALLDTPGASCGPELFGFRSSISPRITKLSITLSLPLAVFHALDVSHVDDNGSATSNFEDETSTWSAVPSGLPKLTQLRHLHLWLDHSDRQFWSFVNERAILSQFEALLAKNHTLSMTLTLPKLHPQKEDPRRHYMKDRSAPLEVHRVLRQRYRVAHTYAGASRVTYAQDFPHCEGHPFYDFMSLAEKEDHEAMLWRRGLDVVQFLSGIR